MGIFSGCLLASDYDGTLADSKGMIPDEVRKAIKYFTTNGGMFTVCTGRTKQGFHAFDKELMNAPVLLANGAMAYEYSEAKTIYVNGINEESRDTLEYIKNNYSDIGIELYGADFSSWVITPHERNILHFEHQSIQYTVTDEIPQSVFPAVKVMVSVGKDRCMDFQKFLDTAPMGQLKYIPQYGDFIEIISKDTDKGTGLLKLAKAYNIEPSHVYAIGDGANDVTMLKAAAVGFVPANGDEYAKKAGDVFVKSNDEFAVADAIYKIEAIIRGTTEVKNESN